MRSAIAVPAFASAVLNSADHWKSENVIIMVGDGMSIATVPQPAYWRDRSALCDRRVSPTHHQPPNGVDLGLGAAACLV